MEFNSKKELPSKLISLIEIFGDANVHNDESELESCIGLLKRYNWDVEGVDLLIKLESCGPLINGDDISHCMHLMRVANRNDEGLNYAESLSENDKLDKVVELCKSDAIQAKQEDVRLIAEGLKRNDLEL